jgi:hypothetical protein
MGKTKEKHKTKKDAPIIFLLGKTINLRWKLEMSTIGFSDILNLRM